MASAHRRAAVLHGPDISVFKKHFECLGVLSLYEPCKNENSVHLQVQFAEQPQGCGLAGGCLRRDSTVHSGVNLHGGTGKSVANSVGGSLPGEALLEAKGETPEQIAAHPHPFYTPIATFGLDYALEPVAYGLKFASARDKDVRALRDEALCGSKTDSAIASGDDCYLSFQLTHELSPV